MTIGSGSTAGANGGAYGAMGGFASDGSNYAAGNPGAGGYAVRHNSGTVVSWVSGSARVAGAVGWYL